MESDNQSEGAPRNLTLNELYRSAMRMRLTRAGLVKIMEENERRDALRSTEASGTTLKS